MRVAINGLGYWVEDEGPRAGAPLLLLHGFTGSTKSWDDAAAELCERVRVIRVDLPGHGRTELPDTAGRCGLPEVSADLRELLIRLEASPAHVLGYSMGGRLALQMALTWPAQVRSLILESGSPGLAAESERAARRVSDEALADRIERDGIEAFVAAWEALPLWTSQRRLPAERRAVQHAGRLANSTHGLALSLRGMGTGAQPSLWEALPALRMPVLFIAGVLDRKFAEISAAMSAAVPTTRLAVIDGAGHTPHLEQPEAFLRLVRDFLGIG